MSLSSQLLPKKIGRPLGVLNTRAQERLSFAPRSPHIVYLVKISPFIEARPGQRFGRKLKGDHYSLKKIPDTPSPGYLEELRARFHKVVGYLLNHGIPLEKIIICSASYYPKVSPIPVIYVQVRKDDVALMRLRVQVSRYKLHCYLEIGDLPPQRRSLLYPHEVAHEV